MSEARSDGSPFFFATDRPPSATAIDEDIYVTITATNPLFPGRAETVDIILSTETAAQLIAALSAVVSIAVRNEASPQR